MNIETVKVNSYLNNKDDIEIKKMMYSLVVGFLLIVLIVIMIILDKNLYYQNELLVIDNEKTLFSVLPNDLKTISKNKYLFIDDKKYYYRIEKIELISENYIHYNVILNMNNDLLVNSINNFKILIRKETMFNYIIRIIKGG